MCIRDRVEGAGTDATALTLKVFTAAGRLLAAYTPQAEKIEKTPDPAKAIPAPAEVPTNCLLYTSTP